MFPYKLNTYSGSKSQVLVKDNILSGVALRSCDSCIILEHSCFIPNTESMVMVYVARSSGLAVMDRLHFKWPQLIFVLNPEYS